MIYISYVYTKIGIIEIRATSRKLLSILFVNEELGNVAENEITKKCAKEIEEYFDGTRKEFQIAVEIEGTEFQRKVLEEVKKIPYGMTISYQQIAKNIGRENSARAVGTTVGKNVLLIIVPCHRVIGTNGSMTGYLGGIERKRYLLELEKIRMKEKRACKNALEEERLS